MRIAVVGAGRWGIRIVETLVGLGHDTVAVDPHPVARARAATAGAHVANDVAEAGPVDAAVVATPATTHADVVDSLWGLDVPIFCEKPLTTDVHTARTLAGRDDGRLHVMHIWRYHPGVELLAAIAAGGELGDVHGLRSTRANWTSPRTDTDAIWTLVPHDITLAIEILGAVPRPHAAIAEYGDGRPTGLWAQCGGGGETWLVVEASTRFADKRREIRLHAEGGVAVLPALDSQHVEIARGSDLEPAIELRRFDDGEPLARELAAFCAFAAGGPAPKSDVHEGVMVVETIAELRHLAGIDSRTT